MFYVITPRPVGSQVDWSALDTVESVPPRGRQFSGYAQTLGYRTVDNIYINIIFLIVTAVVAYHGLSWRDENGESDFVRLLFGSIALLFFFRVLLVDVMGVWG